MRLVVALGGNAILRRGASGTVATQREAVMQAAAQLARLAADGHELVLTHGNGPQVGQLLVQQRAAALEVPPMPLDVLGAQTQGQLGYLLQQALGNALRAGGVERTVAAVVTQVVVDAHDPAFADPDKPVGAHYTETEMEHRAARAASVRGGERERVLDDVVYRRQSDGTWRRVVPSPPPVRVVEADAVPALLDAGIVPLVGGGGGAPVVETAAGLAGVEAVIDKDRVAALLAAVVAADVLLILTDVAHVVLDYGTPHARPLAHLDVAQAQRYLREGQFPSGSMGPKVEAAITAANADIRAVITSLDRVDGALAGDAGTEITQV